MTNPLPDDIAAPARGWRRRAKCQGDDPLKYDLAHIPKSATGAIRAAAAAELCAGCPVIRDCAADAYIHASVYVVRGGVYTTSHKSSALLKAAKGN